MSSLFKSTHNRSGPSRNKQPVVDRNNNFKRVNLLQNELNSLLPQLVDVYPQHDISICRQALRTASPESRLAVAANTLADHVIKGDSSKRQLRKGVPPWEIFRSESYISAASKTLSLEFKSLARSTIQNILAEQNYDYLRSRARLQEVHAKSWRVKFLSFFSWSSKENEEGSGSTGCPELDHEIYLLKSKSQRKQLLESDQLCAEALNEEQYQSLFECECCFGDFAWESVCFCPDFHCFCRLCLKRSVEENLFGQGSGLDYTRASVKCISSTAYPACSLTISPSLLPSLLPTELYSMLQDHFTKSELDKSGIILLRCPFCLYAVCDDPSNPSFARWRPPPLLLAAGLLVVCNKAWQAIVVASLLATWTLSWLIVLSCLPDAVRHELDKVARHTQRPPWATILRCENPPCKRSSCLKCGREWVGIHDCKDDVSSKQAFVARKMDEALKRICPNCHTSFLKSGGCNKMTCPCGYKMCYLCRADVRQEQYNHFCNHFHFNPGQPCTECSKCLLFQEEKEDNILREAKISAEHEWESEKGELHGGSRRAIILDDSPPGIHLRGLHATLFHLGKWYGS